jgi:hypothetical protein
MKRPFKQAAGDEKKEGKHSVADGRWQWHDLSWRLEETSSSGESQCKSTSEPWRCSMREESANGRTGQQLDDSELRW